MKVTAALSALPPIMELLGGFGMAAALWYGAKEIAANQLTRGEFSSFLGGLLLMYGPAKKLSRVNASLQQSTAASERIFEILDMHSEVVDRPGAAMLTARRARRSSSTTSASTTTTTGRTRSSGGSR